MRPLARIAAVAVALISAGLIAGTAQAAVRAELAADVDPGPSSSRPSKLTAVGDSVYFYADGGPDRQGLWRTNGRLTQLVRPVGDPDLRIYWTEKVAFQGRLYLMGSETGNNYRLWRTVPGGGRIEPVPGWPKELKAGSKPTVANGLLFFRGGDGRHKNELWKYDGERASLVKDINPGPAGSFPGYITGLGNQVIFNATDGVHGGELWRSDGTASGTRMIGEINPGAKGTNMAWLTRVGDSVYLTADTPGHWLEPWRTDGEQLGLVAAEHEGPEWDNITSFAGLGGKVYFTANNELWESDDAWPEAEVHPIADDPDFPTTAKNAPVAAGNRIFFASFAGDWTGTMQSWPSFYDGEKIVTLTDPEEEFDYPWGYPQFFKEFGGRVFFVGADTLHGTELRVVSGRHYRLFADILEGDSSSRPRGFARSKHFMYFVADDGIHGREIWRLRRTAG